MTPETPGPKILRFGVFEVDLRAGELRKQGVRVKLQDQPFHVLNILLERPGEVVTREKLRSAIWQSDTFVDFDNGLNTSINKLREALGDSADSPRFVETLPRRGYRFIAPVSSEHGKERTLNVARWKVAGLVAIVAVAVVAAGGTLLRLRPSRKLTEKDTIVLADFTNTTGDPVFDDTLKQGLRVQLEQSPFLSLLSDERMRQTLRLMGRPADTRLTPDIGRELCQRANSAAVLSGSIASLGNQYVLGLKAVNCGTGDPLAEEQETADGKEKVLTALSQAATKLRRRLGESLKSIEKFESPLEQATTGSLEALQAFSRGWTAMERNGDYDAAEPFFQRAVSHDPNFAMAYAALGVAASGSDLRVDSVKKAYELRNRVTEREKFYIESHYHQLVSKDRAKARDVYQLWSQTYPRDAVPHNQLGAIYLDLGHYGKAVQEFREAVRLEPTSAMFYTNLIGGYLYLNRPIDTRAAVEEAQVKKLDSPGLHYRLYQLAFFVDDKAGMAEQVSQLGGQLGMEDVVLEMEAKTAAYFGKLGRARELTDRASAAAERVGDKGRAAAIIAGAALRETLVGNIVRARNWAKSPLSKDAGYEDALLLALIGESARAETLVEELEKDQSLGDDSIRLIYLPATKAQLALNRNDTSKAIEALQATEPYELGVTGNLYFAVYVRGKTYLATGKGEKATAEFQKILDHRGIVLNEPTGALAHLQLGRAYAMQGDAAKARAAYQDFLTLWKDADPDIPILREAKSEYAKLQSLRAVETSH